MEQIHRYRFEVYPKEVDCTTNMRLTSLGDSILNVAGLAANESGFGSIAMVAQGLTWVLSRLAIEIEEMPKQSQTITIETWVEECGRLFTTRNFRIYNHENRTIGYATSLWALIDIYSQSPINLTTRPELIKCATGVIGDIAKPTKLSKVTAAPALQHRVVYSDIDFNNHTNSMKYLEWMLNSYPYDKIITNQVARLELNYLHEARVGEQVAIRWKEVGQETLFDICKSDEVEVCRAKLLWR